MNKGMAGLATLGVMLLGAGTAHASITIDSTAFGMDDMAGASAIIDFDTPLPPGFTLTGGLVRNASDGLGAAPAWTDGVKETSFYLSANPGDPATIRSTTGYRSVSFFWGSIDAYNTVTLLDQSGAAIAAFGGMAVQSPANGDQGAGATNRRVTFSTAGDTGPIYGLRFASGSPAFEVDNIAFAAPVPEPATWGMTIAGFGALGFLLRRRRPTAARIRFA